MREAVELLADKREALLVNMDGRAAGILTPRRSCSKIAPARASPRPRARPASPPARCTPGSTRIPSYGSIVPPIHQTSTYVQPAPGRVRGGLRLRALREPHPLRARARARASSRAGSRSCFASGMAATHALLTAHCRPATT